MADKVKRPLYGWDMVCLKCGPLEIEGRNYHWEEIPMRDVFTDAREHLEGCPGPVAILLRQVGER
ncbi:MAG: hypothetical protein HY687_00710 [Chloroflexi bacterium]|nr:hypothetical protein [Chloroflexota bacterium]